MSEEREPYRNRRPTEKQMLRATLDMLRAGLLPSALPGELMVRFSLTAEKAQAVAIVAAKRHKLDTKPLNQSEDL